jgi:ATP-dependent Clp protease ATP-binding subunit ClpA
MEAKGLGLTVTDAASDWLLERGYDETFGARPLRRLVQREIENALARRSIANELPAGTHVTVDVAPDGETLAFSLATSTTEDPMPATVPQPLSV